MDGENLKLLEGPLKAVSLIREYIAKSRDRIVTPYEGERTVSLELMHFHIGQLLASEGQEHWPEAIEAFRQSSQKDNEPWNAYVSATIGFLENDIGKVEDAIKAIEVSKEEGKKSGNLGTVKNFKKALEIGERDYKKVYSWHRD